MKNLISTLLFTCCLLVSTVHCETIALFAAAGVKVPAEAIIKQFEATTGHTVLSMYDTAGAAEAKFVASNMTGVLITTEPRLLQSAVLKGGTLQRVGDTVAGVAISTAFAKQNPTLNIATPDALKQVLLTANSIAYSDPARGATVGAHFTTIIQQLGIRDTVLAKAKTARDGIETMQRVASGEADLGITQVSEIVQSNPALLLGAFPTELELATRYNSWVAGNASAAVQALAQAFGSESGRASLKQFGLRLP
jgi:molybdate transport system substrate-binding protein